MSHDRRSFTARIVFPGDGEPIESGTVEFAGGVITAVHGRHDPRAERLGNVALLPGLVNAHTHLEFSDLPRPIEPALPFADWVRGVVSRRRNRTLQTAEIVGRGMREAAAGGTAVLGEIATDDDVDARLSPGTPQVVMFRELLGFGPEETERQLQVARRFLDDAGRVSARQPPDSLFRFGLSPHAPYSVHPELLGGAVELAKERNVPVAMHLAETREELEFLDRQTGPLVEMLKSFGAWHAGVVPPGSRPLEVLRVLAEAARGLVIHGNYLNGQEQRFLASCDNLSLVYCPRTHAYFSHDPHPWQDVLQRGGNVALGTDSRASNSDLSLWGELCFLRDRCPDVSDAELLRLGTINGAKALGVDEFAGSLAPGKRAEFALVELGEAGSEGSLFRAGRSCRGGYAFGR